MPRIPQIDARVLPLLVGAIALLGCNDFLEKSFSFGIAPSSSSSSSSSSGDDTSDDDADGLSNSVETLFEMDTRKSDTDHDGIGDGIEFALDTGDPLDPESSPTPLNRIKQLDPSDVISDSDSDLDGLGDTFEEAHSLSADDADTDDDGYNDGVELLANSDPFVASDRPVRDEPPTAPGDLPTGSAPTDSDKDGLADAVEADEGSLSTQFDSDRDGFSDGIEFAAGSDPRDNSEIPNLSVPAAP